MNRKEKLDVAAGWGQLL